MTVWSVPIPLRSQIGEPTLDGQPDENRAANCVPASLSSPLSYYTGTDYYGDELKDAVYGQGYTGATDPARFIAYCTAHGVPMVEHEASGTAALDLIIAAIKAGMCANGAIPSAWGTQDAAYVAAHGSSTHEITWCGYDDVALTLTAMNPEIGGVGGWQVMPVAWWASRICYNRVFILEGDMATPYDPYFNISADGKTYTLKSNPAVALSGGELALYQLVKGAPGLPVGGVSYALQSQVGASQLAIRRYERAFMVWDPEHKLDSPPQTDPSGQFYLAHVNDQRILGLFGLLPPPPPPPAPAKQLYLDGVSVPLGSITLPPVTVPGHTVEVK